MCIYILFRNIWFTIIILPILIYNERNANYFAIRPFFLESKQLAKFLGIQMRKLSTFEVYPTMAKMFVSFAL